MSVDVFDTFLTPVGEAREDLFETFWGPRAQGCGDSCILGNGNGILFREYCFGEENSLSLTEFWGKLGEFAFTHTHTQIIG